MSIESENNFENSSDNDDDLPGYEKEFNDIVAKLDEKESDPQELKDLLRKFYINYNSLNQFNDSDIKIIKLILHFNSFIESNMKYIILFLRS